MVFRDESYPKILVADRDHLLRQSIAWFFSSRRCQVDQVTNGSDAWVLLQCNPYDMLITDLRLAGINGLELLRLARRFAPPPTLIVFGDHIPPEINNIALSLGAAACYVKPMSEEILVSLLSSLLQKAAA